MKAIVENYTSPRGFKSSAQFAEENRQKAEKAKAKAKVEVGSSAQRSYQDLLEEKRLRGFLSIVKALRTDATINPPGLIVRDESDGSTLPVEDSDATPNWKSLTAQLGFGKKGPRKGELNPALQARKDERNWYRLSLTFRQIRG